MDRHNWPIVSRPRAFSLLGSAVAVSFAVPPMVFTASNADDRQSRWSGVKSGAPVVTSDVPSDAPVVTNDARNCAEVVRRAYKSSQALLSGKSASDQSCEPSPEGAYGGGSISVRSRQTSFGKSAEMRMFMSVRASNRSAVARELRA